MHIVFYSMYHGFCDFIHSLLLNRYRVGAVVAPQDRNTYDVVKAWADGLDQKLSKYGIFPQGPQAEKVQKRLKELKIKYDPENVFHQNVPNIDPKKE